jgi:hypothetical protein
MYMIYMLILIHVYDIYADTICCLFVCENVAPQGHEVELRRASTHQEPERPSRGGLWVGERCQREDAEVRPDALERAARRHHFDEPGARTSHAPLADARADFEDICHRLEVVLQGVPEGMWSCI